MVSFSSIAKFAVLGLLVVILSSQNLAHCYTKQRDVEEDKSKATSYAPPEEEESSCDIYQGKWVYEASYPLYEAMNCPFILNQFDCQSNSRPDSLYLSLKWQPLACDLPIFDGDKFLTRFRDKNIMFVGDSLSLNQWQSLTCMLHTAVPRAYYTVSRIGDLSIFKFLGYNISVTFSRNAFLVDIVSDVKSRRRVLKLDSITSGDAWKAADVLIFNSWHWWLHTGHEQPWDMIEYGGTTRKDMDRLEAYEIALKTWARWVKASIDPSKTTVFFQGISPDHANGSDWGMPMESCLGQKGPFIEPRYPMGPHPAQVVLERILKTVPKQVELLDVTGLSQLRKDGHPSVYGTGGRSFNDCSHWCLAGVPDTWNLLLYASLLKHTQLSYSSFA